MPRWFRPALACAAWLTATTALAQSAPLVQLIQPPAPPAPPAAATPVAPVTVQAPLSPAELKEQAVSFVRSYAASTVRLDQIARWREPICAQIGGLKPVEAYQVQARLEEVAKAAGARLLAPGCAANVDIWFTEEPQVLLDRIAARQEEALGYFHSSDTKALKTVTRPIQAWYMTATTGSGGPNAGAMFANVGGARYDSEVVDDPESLAPKGCGDSRFSACQQSVFKHVLVVVDSGRVQGHSRALVSDYVAMLVLAQARSLEGCKVLPSVTDLFSACPGRTAPDSLTPADAAYLAALYAANLEAKKAGEQSDIAERMAKILIKANPVAR